MQVGSLPCRWQVHSKDGSPMHEPPHPPLARGKVRCVGDQIAVVIAATYAQAKDAAARIVDDSTHLPPGGDMNAPLARGTPRPDHNDTNPPLQGQLGTKAQT